MSGGRFFSGSGQTYREPQLVLFSDQVQSACGYAGASTGRFIVRDEKVYLDLSFFEEMQQQLGARGFRPGLCYRPRGGPSCQNLLGIMDEVMSGGAG